MAAGLGFKDFTTGEVLTAADVDGYLMQGIWVFASAAARDAAVTSPQEGNACYLKDTDVIQVYTGSTWAAQSASNPISSNIIDAKGDLIVGSAADTAARLAVGTNDYVLTADSAATNGVKWAALPSSSSALTLITPTSTANSGGSVTTTGGEVSFSGCTSVSVNGVFSSTYTNYLIITDSIEANTQTDIYFRLRASGTDTTTNYSGMTFTKPFATGTAAPVSIGTTTFGTANIYFGDGNNTGKFFNNFIISSPNIATKTSLTGALISEGTYQTIGGYQSDNTQFDGFTFYTTTNNITGKVRVYGYAK